MKTLIVILLLAIPYRSICQGELSCLGMTESQIFEVSGPAPMLQKSQVNDSTTILFMALGESGKYIAYELLYGACVTSLLYLPLAYAKDMEAILNETCKKNPEVDLQWINAKGEIIGMAISMNPAGEQALTIITYKP